MMHIVKNQNSISKRWLEKIELGSAQFGLDYGVNNGKKVNRDCARLIHKALINNGSYLIDTAPSYGDSEKVISSIVENKAKIITKLLPLSNYSAKEIIDGIEESRTLFNDQLYGLMVHNSSDLFDENFLSVIDYLNNVRSKELKVGVSVYDPLDVFEASKIIKLDMLQLPINILDQRSDSDEFKAFINNNNIEIHARSIFLQGLLLMDKNTPESLIAISPYIEAVKSEAALQDLTIYELCILYVFKQNWIDHVVIGLDNVQQTEILINTVSKLSDIQCQIEFKSLACYDINLINPAKWTYGH